MASLDETPPDEAADKGPSFRDARLEFVFRGLGLLAEQFAFDSS